MPLGESFISVKPSLTGTIRSSVPRPSTAIRTASFFGSPPGRSVYSSPSKPKHKVSSSARVRKRTGCSVKCVSGVLFDGSDSELR